MTEQEEYREKYCKEAIRLRELWEKEQAQAKKPFNMTISEWNKLSLNEMQALYDQYPKEVEELIRSKEPHGIR